MLLNNMAGPVPGPCASRMMVPSSMFQSTSASISCSSSWALSAAIQPRRSPNATGFRSLDMLLSPLRGARAHLARGKLHRLDDFRIGATAAQIAGEVMTDLVLVRVRVFGEELARHQHEARRAKAALGGSAFEKGLLHGAQFSARRQMLDRHDLGAVGEDRKEETPRHRLAVDQHRAAAAQALGAALARAEEVEALLQELHEVLVRRDFGRDLLAVEGEMDRAHGASLLERRVARGAERAVDGLGGQRQRDEPHADGILDRVRDRG